MDQAVLTLAAAGMGAVAALAGGALSPFVGAQRAHQQWVRDKRAVLCENYFAVLNQAQETIISPAGIPEGEIPEADRVVSVPDDAFLEVFPRLVAETSRLELWASDPLQKATDDLWRAYQRIWLGQSDGFEPAFLEQAAQEFADKARDVKRLIRHELGID